MVETSFMKTSSCFSPFLVKFFGDERIPIKMEAA
jgi:hypothetical protein